MTPGNAYVLVQDTHSAKDGSFVDYRVIGVFTDHAKANGARQICRDSEKETPSHESLSLRFRVSGHPLEHQKGN